MYSEVAEAVLNFITYNASNWKTFDFDAVL